MLLIHLQLFLIFVNLLQIWQGITTFLFLHSRFFKIMLTLQDVLHDRLQHHLLVRVLHQDEPGKVFKDQLLEAWQLLPGKQAEKVQRLHHQPLPEGLRARRGLTDLQVGASFLSRKGMVICSSASRKNLLRTELLS